MGAQYAKLTCRRSWAAASSAWRSAEEEYPRDDVVGGRNVAAFASSLHSSCWTAIAAAAFAMAASAIAAAGESEGAGMGGRDESSKWKWKWM
jgi:hypothetical protein